MKKIEMLLVNTNRARPPIAPVGLDYIASALLSRGIEPALLDLTWEEHPQDALKRVLAREAFDLIGLSVRNIDDSSGTTREFFLDPVRGLVRLIRERSSAPVVLGGCVFSIMPERALRYCEADFGIRGDGEDALAAFASCIAAGGDCRGIPGLIFRGEDGVVVSNRPAHVDLAEAQYLIGRDFIDNRRYFLHGGQGGIETRRGCDRHCAYCADPVAKGNPIRLRRPGHVVRELSNLLRQGVDCLHICDAEFNRPPDYAEHVCRAIIESGLSEQIRWYAYCSPAPFPASLGRAMREAGCAGINFGADSADPGMLSVLGRDHTPEDIESTARICRENSLAVMYDLLIGAPGETRESVRATIEFMRRLAPTAVGISAGVRLYEGTPLYGRLERETPDFFRGKDPLRPLYYIEPGLGVDIEDYIRELIGDDLRFLSFLPDEPGRDYGYTSNRLLSDAIEQGCRGAYWHVLRRVQGA